MINKLFGGPGRNSLRPGPREVAWDEGAIHCAPTVRSLVYFVNLHHHGAKRRMTTLASCSHHARISHALQEYWPAHYMESSMPQRCSSTCWDTGSERRPRRGCHRWIRDYRRRDSGPIRILLLAKLRPRRVQISDKSWSLRSLDLMVPAVE